MSIFNKQTATRIEYVDLDTILYETRNPKDHDIGEIYNSIKRHGFIAPLILNESTGKLVAGHGRCDTLKQIRAEKLFIPKNIKIDGNKWLVPTMRGLTWDSETEALAYLIADNAIVEKGNWDHSLLGELLKDLAQTDGGLAGTGYDNDDLDNLLEQLGSDIVEAQENNAMQREPITCPHCGETFEV